MSKLNRNNCMMLRDAIHVPSKAHKEKCADCGVEVWQFGLTHLYRAGEIETVCDVCTWRSCVKEREEYQKFISKNFRNALLHQITSALRDEPSQTPVPPWSDVFKRPEFSSPHFASLPADVLIAIADELRVDVLKLALECWPQAANATSVCP